MKKFKSIAAISTCALTALSSVPFSAMADDGVIYGTMNIPYADFYSAELEGSSNSYEVDAVSSATTSKWKMNGEGQLFEGTFNSENEDGTGTILGVTYPVAISKTDLDALGENNYGFTELAETPTAYKNVTVSDGKASFSAVQDSDILTASDASIKLSTNTPWGDYLIDVENKPEMRAIYGAVVKTADGNSYGMVHEANIWRGELAWSSGIKTTEPHGNPLPYEDYVSLMGATITEVDFITLDGYITIPTETYVPVKFASEFTVENSEAVTGNTAFSVSGIPADFEKFYSVNGLDITASDDSISYADAKAGSYTLTISDNFGKYAEISAPFTLTTDVMPAVYVDGKIVKADDADESEFENFMSKISRVTVGEKTYNASGKGSVRIISEDGSIDFTANSRGENVFDGSGEYTISVEASGYTTPLEIVITKAEPENPTEPEQPTTDEPEKPTEPAQPTTDEPEKPTKPEKPAYTLGDVNKDNAVDAVDASLILTEYANIATSKGGTFDKNTKSAADVNKDNAIDAIDASKVLTYYADTATGKTPSWN